MMSRPARLNRVSLTQTTTVCRAFQRKAVAQRGSATDIGAVILNCRFGLSRGPVPRGSNRTLARVFQ